ncbi:MAG TPA: phenylalanine--tRNA ligase subunit beta [Planctomycetota bacterium]|nr:phenylalanine--tRNA ligase subunit beta [Planctomycetota bacterium]
MKLPLPWLQEFLPGLKLSPEAIAEVLASIGLPLEATLNIGGVTVFDVEVTANRGDCLSVLGLARDLGAKLKLPVHVPDMPVTENGPAATQVARVTVEDGVKCPLYTARIVQGVKVGPSPEWLKTRLVQMGLEPRNNIVDITNYVMYEMGQPLHAFDLAKLTGPAIIVRRATLKDHFIPLYGNPVKLTGDDLVIADAEKPVALGGIVGGRDSGITETTRDILLESAYFQPGHVRLRSKAHGFKTDSSMRFERGIDAQGVDFARRRAVSLILQIAGGNVCPGVLTVASEHVPMPAPVRLRLSRAQKLLGFAIPQPEAVELLRGLGCKVKEVDEDTLSVTPLSSRHDLMIEADLIEELVRMAGYDRIPDKLTMLARIPPVLPEINAARAIRGELQAAEFIEILTDSLVDSKHALDPNPWNATAPLVLQNPMRLDHDSLRVSLIRSALETLQLNLSRGAARQVNLFEIGPVFLPRKTTLAGGELPNEAVRLLLLSTRGVEPIQTALAMVARRFGLTVRFEPRDTASFEPKQTAQVLLVADGAAPVPLGPLGKIAPALAQQFALADAPYVAEVDITPLLARTVPVPAFKAIPRMPATDRDISLTLPEEHTWGSLQSAILNLKEPILESLEFGEVYRGKQIPAGRKSYFFKIWYRAADKTLTREETNETHERVVGMLKSKFDATLRVE